MAKRQEPERHRVRSAALDQIAAKARENGDVLVLEALGDISAALRASNKAASRSAATTIKAAPEEETGATLIERWYARINAVAVPFLTGFTFALIKLATYGSPSRVQEFWADEYVGLGIQYMWGWLGVCFVMIYYYPWKALGFIVWIGGGLAAIAWMLGGL